MGGFSQGSGAGANLLNALGDTSNPLGAMFKHVWTDLGVGDKFRSFISGAQGGQSGQPQPTQQPQQQQGGAAAYRGLQMPPYTYHTSMPQFNLSNAGGLPSYNFNGGALNLPGWALQQAGQTPTAGNWRPTVTAAQNGQEYGLPPQPSHQVEWDWGASGGAGSGNSW